MINIYKSKSRIVISPVFPAEVARTTKYTHKYLQQ